MKDNMIVGLGVLLIFSVLVNIFLMVMWKDFYNYVYEDAEIVKSYCDEVFYGK